MNLNKFASPDNSFRGRPFWSWNGLLEREKLLNQINIFKTMGMGGILFHSRNGLKTEYLGEEWFDFINACANKASQCGLEAWLYDEDRWPSGSAGGLVTENKEYRMKFIRATVTEANAFSQDMLSGDLIAAYCADMEHNTYRNLTELKKNEKISRNFVITFSVEYMQHDSNYNGYTYLDTLNIKATNAFLKFTHEKYKEKCKDLIGKSIKGIFTDEPHRGALMCGFSVENSSAEYLAPYTDDLFEIFFERKGYSLKESLPQLFFFEESQKFSKVKYDYTEILEELFTERFIIPIKNWCSENELVFTGHFLHEDWLSAQVCMTGSLMRLYQYMDVPGIDVLERNNNKYWIAKQLQSVSRQTGKKRLLSEMFGCTGWQLTFADHKRICDWQLLYGINDRIQHLAWYTMEGEAKRDYPASIFSQSYWYKDYKFMEDYFSRVAYFRYTGKPCCDVLVISPIESIWGMIYPGWADNTLHAVDEKIKEIEGKYEQVFYSLSSNKIDFDYGDEEIISKFGKIEDSYFVVGNMKYSAVILPAMITIRKSTLNLLKKFINMGGTVITTDGMPLFVDGVYAKEQLENDLRKVQICEISGLADALNIKPRLELLPVKGNLQKVFLQTNKDENGIYYMLLNTDEENECIFKINNRKNKYLEKWDAQTGNVTLLADSADAQIEVNLSALGELLLCETDINNGYPKENITVERKEIPVNAKEFEYSLNEYNVCVLDKACFVLNGEKTYVKTEPIRIDGIIREKFGFVKKGGSMIQPWYREKFLNADMDEKSVLVKTVFEFEINKLPEKLIVAIESAVNFEICVNGKKNALKLTGEHWVDDCFTLFEISQDVIKNGINSIELSTVYRDGSAIENIYLLGNFGVLVSGSSVILTELPRKLVVGDIAEQGLPFYGGGLTYKIPLPKVNSSERLVMGINNTTSACCKVRQGENDSIVAFPPYEIDVTESMGKEIYLEYEFTRRNTFGPFHKYPADDNNCNPLSFRTEDEEYLNDGFVTLPQGMEKPLNFYSVKNKT